MNINDSDLKIGMDLMDLKNNSIGRMFRVDN